MKKKARPELFPQPSTASPSKPFVARLGATFTIGKPVNINYLHIHDSPLNNESSQSLHPIPGRLLHQIVEIIGILELSNARQRVILQRKDKQDFYEGLGRVYADMDQAMVAKELILLR